MGKDPLLEDYRYEIKENFGRRGFALLIDEIVLTIPMFLLTAIFVFIVFQSNPFGIIIGQIGPLVYIYEVYGVQSTSTFVALIPSIFISLGLTIFYFTFFESNGRRTMGKKFLHLEVLRSDGKFLTPLQALRRNLVKIIAGALGFYLLGLIGWGLFIGLSCFLDFKISPGKKRDVRQRLTEASLGTMVYLEHDEVPLGEISIPGEKIQEIKEKKREPRPKRAPSMVRRKKTSLELGAKPEKEEGLPMKKKTPLLQASDEEKEEEKEKGSSKPSLVPALMEKDLKEQEEEPPEEEEEEKPKKQSFFSKLFGGGTKKAKEEESEEGPEPDDLMHEEGEMAPAKEVPKDEVILQFMFDFDIDEKRAQGLYKMGYRNKVEFKDAIPQDLIMIEGINPTIAKRIIKIASE